MPRIGWTEEKSKVVSYLSFRSLSCSEDDIGIGAARTTSVRSSLSVAEFGITESSILRNNGSVAPKSLEKKESRGVTNSVRALRVITENTCITYV